MTDSLASTFPSSPASDRSSTLSSFGTENFPDSIDYPPTPPLDDANDAEIKPLSSVTSAPRDIFKTSFVSDLLTPPLTPDNISDGGGSLSSIHTSQNNAALDFLSTIFPRNALGALPFAKSVSITSPDIGATFEGVVLELPNKPKTFYVDGKCAGHVNLRERYESRF